MQLGAHYPGEPQNPEKKVGPGGILGCNWWPNPPGKRGIPRICLHLAISRKALKYRGNTWVGGRSGARRERKREKKTRI